MMSWIVPARSPAGRPCGLGVSRSRLSETGDGGQPAEGKRCGPEQVEDGPAGDGAW